MRSHLWVVMHAGPVEASRDLLTVLSGALMPDVKEAAMSDYPEMPDAPDTTPSVPIVRDPDDDKPDDEDDDES